MTRGEDASQAANILCPDSLDLANDLGHRQRPAIDEDLLCQLLAAGIRAFQAHQDGRLELSPGAYDLVVGRIRGQLTQLVANDGDQLAHLVRAGSRVDAKDTAVAVGRYERIDRIHQATLFAHLLKKREDMPPPNSVERTDAT